MNTKKYISHLINGETDNSKIDAIILGFAKKVEMTATAKQMEFNGKVGVGIFINGGLSKFFYNGIELLDEIKYLNNIGYTVEVV